MSLSERKAVERMADRDKVICDLQILRTWCAVDPIYGIGLTPRECEMAVRWLDDALELLKAQEAIPPGKTEILEGITYASCGYCGNAVMKQYSYCPFCGRKVKWYG